MQRGTSKGHSIIVQEVVEASLLDRTTLYCLLGPSLTLHTNRPQKKVTCKSPETGWCGMPTADL